MSDRIKELTVRCLLIFATIGNANLLGGVNT